MPSHRIRVGPRAGLTWCLLLFNRLTFGKPCKRGPCKTMPPPPEETPKNGNGTSKASVVAALLGDKDPMVKLVTLGLVVFTGVGNFWATNKAESRNVDEVNRALDEIHYIRARIDYFESRQVDMSNRIKAIDERAIKIEDALRKPSP